MNLTLFSSIAGRAEPNLVSLQHPALDFLPTVLVARSRPANPSPIFAPCSLTVAENLPCCANLRVRSIERRSDPSGKWTPKLRAGSWTRFCGCWRCERWLLVEKFRAAAATAFPPERVGKLMAMTADAGKLEQMPVSGFMELFVAA